MELQVPVCCATVVVMKRAAHLAIAAFCVVTAALTARAQERTANDARERMARTEEHAASAASAERAVTADFGLILLGSGAALLSSTASGYVLLEALTTPDDNRNPQQHPELVQAGGFAALTLASLSAGLMLVGAAILVEEDLEQPHPPAGTHDSDAENR